MDESKVSGAHGNGSGGPVTAIIIPTFNEKENIEQLVNELDRLPLNKWIIVVDDHSPDGTGELVEALRQRIERLVVVHRPGKSGLGTAYISGFQKSLTLQVDYIVTMDADFSHAPRYIPELVKLAEKVDVAIGSRYVPGGATVHFGLHRRFLSRGANLLARHVLRMTPHDCTSGFRCYRRQVLAELDPASIVSDGYSFLIELLFRCLRAGYSVGEIPITFVNRRVGSSKISKREIFKAIMTIWRLSWRP
ncbi:polyprenol monophosphomannose synthase [bacterium]|nr:polyprenol monophosphomannose synthase [bacterium]